MNAFNIRELQGILKRRFFNDLVNSTDHRQFMNQTLIGLRFKNNSNLSINPDTSLIYNFGTTINAKSKNTLLQNAYEVYNNAYIFKKDELYFTEVINFINSIKLTDFTVKLIRSFDSIIVLFKEALYAPTYIFFALSAKTSLVSQLLTLPTSI
jgi:hypothetical protein